MAIFSEMLLGQGNYDAVLASASFTRSREHGQEHVFVAVTVLNTGK